MQKDLKKLRSALIFLILLLICGFIWSIKCMVYNDFTFGCLLCTFSLSTIIFFTYITIKTHKLIALDELSEDAKTKLQEDKNDFITYLYDKYNTQKIIDIPYDDHSNNTHV